MYLNLSETSKGLRLNILVPIYTKVILNFIIIAIY